MDSAINTPYKIAFGRHLQAWAKGLQHKHMRAVKFLTAPTLDCLLDIAARRGYQKRKRKELEDGSYPKLADTNLEGL